MQNTEGEKETETAWACWNLLTTIKNTPSSAAAYRTNCYGC